MSMTEASAEYFNRVASKWDSIRAGYFTEKVREAAIARAYLRPEMEVADVGAGTGFMTDGLAALVKKVNLLDGSEAMLEVAKKNLRQFDNIAYHQADGLNLPLPDDSQDAVFANMYLHHCPDPLAAIREMARVLKPGGRLVMTDMDSHPYEWMKEEMTDVWMGFEREQVRDWLREAGLVNRIVSNSGQSCSTESKNPEITGSQGQKAQISILLASGTKRVSMRSDVENRYRLTAEGRVSCCGSNSEASNPIPSAETKASPTTRMDQSGCCGGGAGATSSCCDKSGDVEALQPAPGYTREEMEQIPGEAGEISLGCGNPVAMAGLRQGETVLDIGSGGGIDAFLAAKRVGPAGKVIGVDMTKAMLRRARQTALKAGYRNVEFREGLAESLPVEDGQVDVVLSNCVINLTEDKGQAFREAYRVLKPGGRLEISDIVTSGPLPVLAWQDAASWAECVAGALPEQEYLDLVQEAGFQDVRVRRSASEGGSDGVEVYSLAVSALK